MDPTSATWVALIGATILLAAIVDSSAHYLRVPSVVGYLGIGLLLQFADTRWAVLSESGRSAFAYLADLGIIVLLFRVGFHSHFERLIAKLRPVGDGDEQNFHAIRVRTSGSPSRYSGPFALSQRPVFSKADRLRASPYASPGRYGRALRQACRKACREVGAAVRLLRAIPPWPRS